MDAFRKYRESLYEFSQNSRDYEVTSNGFNEWYYDCLPKDKHSKILDIGCGDGKFLFFLIKRCYSNIEGLEISEQQVNEAKKHLLCPIHVVSNSMDFLNEQRSIYQMITMNDVLEHIPKNEIVMLLKAVLESLKPAGYVVINVPQLYGIRSLFCRYNDFTHEILFTERSLRQTMILAGFSEIRFIPQKLQLKINPRHIAYRIARTLWYQLLKVIYTIESPGEKYSGSSQVRLVVSGKKLT